MQRFLLHLLFFLLAVAAVAGAVFSLDVGYADPYYYRISGPPAPNLVLGTSKAGQGIRPDVLGAALDREFLNFSFSLSVSPYGSTYARRIAEKLRASDHGGVFVLAVDPWGIAAVGSDTSAFPERTAFLEQLPSVTARPNLPYLVHYLERPYLNILLRQSPAVLHRDGWLEVRLGAGEAATARRTAFTLAGYRSLGATLGVSTARLESLADIISLLDRHGRVYLVRLPVSTEMMAIEESLMPDFSDRIGGLVDRFPGVQYLDMSPDNGSYTYHDGLHLTPDSGARSTRRIAEWIRASATQLRGR
ncbi:hypothetical protein [Lewinella sp. IMCC34183]|uniref:hypothetical protein n=1 Tax=Lewinella sp. IMCC34183 TaxID=2248762 RepID=UPI000E26153C|nr:hypothetical protein [Lewinella sp. IMCC34183]